MDVSSTSNCSHILTVARNNRNWFSQYFHYSLTLTSNLAAVSHHNLMILFNSNFKLILNLIEFFLSTIHPSQGNPILTMDDFRFVHFFTFQLNSFSFPSTVSEERK